MNPSIPPAAGLRACFNLQTNLLTGIKGMKGIKTEIMIITGFLRKAAIALSRRGAEKTRPGIEAFFLWMRRRQFSQRTKERKVRQEKI
jgi:hypothetical protein